MPAAAIKMTDMPKNRFFFSGEEEFAESVYNTAPPIPMPVPAACIKAVSGYATFIAVSALSPSSLPTKKPSAML